MKIIWSKSAAQDLLDIISYIKYKSGKNIARTIYDKIRSKIRKIAVRPYLGRVVPELKNIGIQEIYQLLESPWKIYYRIESKKVLILAIIDGRRNLEEILYQKIIEQK